MEILVKSRQEYRRWIRKQVTNVKKASKEGCEQLFLTASERVQVSEELQNIVERELPRLVKGLTLVAALGVKTQHDQRRFEKRGVSADLSEDLAHTVATKILGHFWSTWPSGNIGAYHAAVGFHVLSDHGRLQKSEKQNLCEPREGGEFPERCNPQLEREFWEDASQRWSHSERIIVRERLSGTSWREIAQSVGHSISDVKIIARRACSFLVKSSSRKKHCCKPRNDRAML